MKPSAVPHPRDHTWNLDERPTQGSPLLNIEWLFHAWNSSRKSMTTLLKAIEATRYEPLITLCWTSYHGTYLNSFTGRFLQGLFAQQSLHVTLPSSCVLFYIYSLCISLAHQWSLSVYLKCCYLFLESTCIEDACPHLSIVIVTLCWLSFYT